MLQLHGQSTFTVVIMYINLLVEYFALSHKTYALPLHYLRAFTSSLTQNSSTVDTDSLAESLANLCGELLSCGEERGRQLAYNGVTEV